MDFLGFSKLMRQRARNLPGEVHTVVKNVAKVYLVTAADITPVDTGAAISNWQIGINASPSGVLPPHVPGKFRSTALENLNATIQAGTSIIDSSKPGDVLHIVNNIEHIGDLNDGSSSQAPAGMTAMAELVARRVPATAKVVKPR